MPNTKTVGPGKDFENLYLWNEYARLQASADQWAECYSGASLLSGGQYVDFTSWVSTSTLTVYPRIYAANGHRHNGISGGAYISGNGSSFFGFMNNMGNIAHFEIDGLNINNVYYAFYVGINTPPSIEINIKNTLITNCNYGLNISANALGITGSINLTNCIFRNMYTGCLIGWLLDGTIDVNVLNCTAVNDSFSPPVISVSTGLI